MNKKTLIILACVAVALMLAIAGFIYALYSGSAPDGSDKKLKADSALLAAIPSDAAAVMTFQDLSKGMPVLSHFCSGRVCGRLSPLQRKLGSAAGGIQGGQRLVQDRRGLRPCGPVRPL